MKKLLLIGLSLLFVVSLVLTAGCSNGNIEESVHLIVEKMNGVESYRQESEMSMRMSGTLDGEAAEVSTSYLVSGVVDNVLNRAWITMEMDIEVPEIDPVSLGLKAYLLDNTVYLSYVENGESSDWYKTRTETESFSDLASIEAEISLLEKSLIRQTGTEKIGDIDCYVVEVLPDSKTLAEYVMKSMEMMDDMTIFMESMVQDLTEDITLTYWIAKDSLYIVKQHMVMRSDISDSIPGADSDSFFITLELTTTLSDFNKEITIELPEEAERAVSVD